MREVYEIKNREKFVRLRTEKFVSLRTERSL